MGVPTGINDTADIAFLLEHTGQQEFLLQLVLAFSHNFDIPELLEGKR